MPPEDLAIQRESAAGDDLPGETAGNSGSKTVSWLDAATLHLPYIPDFRLDEVLLYFVPTLDQPREVYHSLTPEALERWYGPAYFTKKGVRFLNTAPAARGAEGPFRVRPGGFRIALQESGKIFTPRPRLEFARGSREVPEQGIPLVSLDKRRPLNPWKPTYIRALNFIKKYEPVRAISKLVEYCLWEIEECGEVSGSTSWENAEPMLSEALREDSDIREVLVDVFQRRPEDFPLGSEIYLRVLGSLDDDGFAMVRDLHSHPHRLKRRHVAVALGKLGRTEALDTLVKLLDDHEVDVRDAALCAIASVGMPPDHPTRQKLEPFLESADIAQHTRAVVALLRGGDATQEKRLIGLIKEKEIPLYNMGELGQVLKDLDLIQAVPFLIKRLRSDRIELRDDAAEVLRELTDLDLEFPSEGGGEVRREAIKRWKKWWEDYKRDRKN